MYVINILKKREIEDFDRPPLFNSEDRKRFFYLSKAACRILETLRHPTNKLCYILQRGYFRASCKFFNPAYYNQKDVEYILKQLNITLEQVSLSDYTPSSYKRQQKFILEEYGFSEFNQKLRNELELEAYKLCLKNIKPKVILISLLDYLKYKKVEFPTYYVLAEIITIALRKFDNDISDKINTTLNEPDKLYLDDLLTYSDEYIYGNKSDRSIKTYKLTLLKKFTHSLRPSQIKKNINEFKELELIFKKVEPVINKIGLSNQLIQYYAQFVIKSQVFQVNRSTPGRKYLLLISFIAYQYYKLNDMLIDKFIQASQSILNTSEREHRENFFNSRKKRSKRILDVSNNVSTQITDFNKAKEIIFSSDLDAEEKILKLKSIFTEEFSDKTKKIQKQLTKVASETNGIIKNSDYYKMLENKSIRLQNRASDVLKNICFDKESSNKELLSAIEYFKTSKNLSTEKSPVEFLKAEDKENLFNEKGKLRTSLYKSLLFVYTAKGIKSGSLSLIYSYKFKSFENYLLPLEYWNENKQEILARAGLAEFNDWSIIEGKLKKKMARQLHKTNIAINTGKNKYISFKPNNDLLLQTPAKNSASEGIKEYLPQSRFISIYEILSTVNSLTKFTDNFEHHLNKNVKKRPQDHTLFAGIIGYGCNIGHRKLGRISHNINSEELVNTVNWYFSQENVTKANDKILNLMGKLQLPRVYAAKSNKIHTGSDGQKYDIAVNSLNASHSFKYFGKDQGVSVYTFLDHSHRLFYSTVINPTEREAAYVIDGLMHNDVVKSDIHSTDTHGYSEIIFGTSHLLGVSFAPRIKNFKDQQLYGFESQSYYKDKGYKVFPKRKINIQQIEKSWDSILRLAATIKLKESTASQLFKRLSSYSRHHPLYSALKQFGRIIKTVFLLKYIDSLDLRQMIEKQLNKVENANKFGKAVFFGDNQEFKYSESSEQILAVNCRILIENAVICWNYLYLTKALANIIDTKQRKDFIRTVRNSSVVTWQHINFQGEYDFSEEMLKNSIKFSLPELLEVLTA